MSAAQVEIVRRTWATWTAGDLDVHMSVYHPEVEWDMTSFRGWVERRVYRGPDEVRAFFDDWLEPWEEYEAGVEQFIDAGDAVLVLCWQRGRPRGGAAVEMKFAQIVRTRAGKVWRVENYADRGEATRVAGLQ